MIAFWRVLISITIDDIELPILLENLPFVFEKFTADFYLVLFAPFQSHE